MNNASLQVVGSLDSDEMQLLMRQSLAKRRVLLVDRHASARDSLRAMLSTLGITAVHGAGNSAEAMRRLKNGGYEIVISDFILGDGRDGQQLLEELRHANLLPLSTIYMIVTGERGYSNVVALAELAPDDYLIKPFTGEQLFSRLLRVAYKKHVLSRIYEEIERGALPEAIKACDWVIARQPQQMYDALRFKGEILLQLGRADEAEAVFRRVLEGRVVPWARMGLAMALRDRGVLDEAERLAEQLVDDTPEFLVAYDFLASVHEAQGHLDQAQHALQRAADASPHNTLRQRLVGDIAVRNKDFLAAEKAYGKVIERSRGSSLCTVDDFANLSRVLLERGHVDAARRLMTDMKRERRGDKQAELASLIAESLCLDAEGSSGKAGGLVDQALELQRAAGDEADAQGRSLSQRLSVDLAHACYAAGREEDGGRLMRRLAAENNEDAHLLGRISHVFERTGRADSGKAILAEVGKEIVDLNNRGVMAARSGDLEESVRLLSQAADQVPNLQFLVNAAKAICTLMDKRGWDEELASRAERYVQRATLKDAKNPKVASARQLYLTVGKKFGINTANV